MHAFGKQNKNYQGSSCRPVQEKAFSDITPAQICEKAGINRSTFYRNYRNISQLKTEMENKILSGVQWEGKLTDEATAMKNIAEQLGYIMEHKDLFQALSADGFRDDIFDKIRDRAIAQARESYPVFEWASQEKPRGYEHLYHLRCSGPGPGVVPERNEAGYRFFCCFSGEKNR